MPHVNGAPLLSSGMSRSMSFSPNYSRNDMQHANGMPSGMSCQHAAR
jgi:hypothetical protein